ncbi:MAG: hypothetical protein ACK559_40400, partial [bacterium]
MHRQARRRRIRHRCRPLLQGGQAVDQGLVARAQKLPVAEQQHADRLAVGDGDQLALAVLLVRGAVDADAEALAGGITAQPLQFIA